MTSGSPTPATERPALRLRASLRDPTNPPTPIDAFARLAGLPHRTLLESRGPAGRYSLLAAAPRRTLAVRIGEGGDPFTELEGLLAAIRPGPGDPGPVADPASTPFPFPGGLIGFLGYEAGDCLERLPEPPADDSGMPDAWFGVYDWAVVWDRRSGGCEIVGLPLPGADEEELRRRMRDVADRLDAGGPGRPERPAGPASAGPPRSSLDRAAFLSGVERIREYIRAGDLFQANLTRRITVESEIGAEALYRRLVAESPAPWGALLEAGGGDVVSISPEGFLSVRGAAVETRPVKGTAPRSSDPERDRALASALLGSEKDRAENVMIVDLLRNDLSRVCQDGSVEVPELVALESHPTVHHLVSTVRGRLRPGMGPVDLLRASFPGGSITGAPKIRAMEILRELEPVRRGVYTGALGIVGPSGDMELSIAIRTAVRAGGRIRYGTGGGITLASDPEAEWRETRDKARAFLRAVGAGEEEE